MLLQALLPILPALLCIAQHLAIFRLDLVTMRRDIVERHTQLSNSKTQHFTDFFLRPIGMQVIHERVELQARPRYVEPHIRAANDRWRVRIHSVRASRGIVFALSLPYLHPTTSAVASSSLHPSTP